MKQFKNITTGGQLFTNLSPFIYGEFRLRGGRQ